MLKWNVLQSTRCRVEQLDVFRLLFGTVRRMQEKELEMGKWFLKYVV
jgi:hypothetical protein